MQGQKFKVQDFYSSQIGTQLSLTIEDMQIKDISEIKGLEDLTHITSLGLSNNEITEIKGLETLTKLENLSLDTNQIKELKGLDTLEKLSFMTLGFNPFPEEAQQFAQMTVMGEDNVKALLKSYNEWKQGKSG